MSTGYELACPECGSTELEERGDVRCYTALEAVRLPDGSVDLRQGSWSTPIETYAPDTTDGGLTIVYCNDCDAELTEDELVPATATAPS